MKTFLIVAGLVVLAVLLYLGIALLVMVIWNALAYYFGFKSIDYGIALLITLGLSLISSFFRGGK